MVNIASYLLITIVIVLLNILYTTNATAVTSPSTSTSTSSTSTSSLIATFGFNTIKGNEIYTSLIQSNNKINAIQVSSAQQIVKLEGVDTLIGYINENQYIDDNLLEIAQVIIENAMYRGTTTKLLLLIDNNNPKLEEKIKKIITDAYDLLKKYNNEQRIELEKLLNIEIISLSSMDRESLSNTIDQKSEFSHSTLNIKDASTILLTSSTTTSTSSLLSSSSSSPSSSIQSKENDKAVDVCNEIVEAFVNDLIERLPPNVQFQGSIMDLDEFINFISAAVVTAIEINNEKYSDVFTKYESTLSMNRACYRARIGAAGAVYSIYRDTIESLVSKTLENFDIAVKKIKPNSSLVHSLKKQVVISANDFISKATTLQKGFKSILTKNSVGIFSSQAGRNKQFMSSIDAQFSNNYYRNKLLKMLFDACKEREESLFVQGVYNPYIRSMPFPPTKINLNYLVDPRTALFGLSYNKLYDEHKDGATIDRADQLLVPGVAKMPFDPNEHATPKDSKPWYSIIKDLWDNL